ncbi:HP1 family phage holin [Shewanella xiamenensis]|uniref:HP1 family phage holin n=1 Tax=Shewanella xiamenensis TaxID=332186 RepID=UPI00313D4343
MNIKPLAPIMDKATTTGSYIASISTAIGGFLSLDKIALLLGIASTIVLFVVQYRLSREKKRQNREFHEARMAAIKAGNLNVINMDDSSE